MDLGILGHTRYTPFIVLGRSRVGSNLLRGLLNAHPQVLAYGEVFRDTRAQDWDHTGYFQAASDAALLQGEPVRFIEARVFGRYPRGVRAVGFKLFYYHARDGAQAGVWPCLLARRDLRVIHLKRGNLLETHLSRKRAALTGQWVNTSGQQERAVTLSLDFDEMLADFQQTRAWEADCDRAFADHPLAQVQYERLAADYVSEARRLQEFLGVEPRAVAPSTFQQSRQPLSATITNYHELKARCAGTPWSDFFTE